jgi:hypothetical protein
VRVGRRMRETEPARRWENFAGPASWRVDARVAGTFAPSFWQGAPAEGKLCTVLAYA